MEDNSESSLNCPVALTSPPRAISIRTASALPALAQVIIGVSPIAIAVFGLAPGLQESVNECSVPVGACQGHRRGAKVVRRVHVRARTDQQVRCLEIVPVRGPEKRGRAIMRSGEHLTKTA